MLMGLSRARGVLTLPPVTPVARASCIALASAAAAPFSRTGGIPMAGAFVPHMNESSPAPAVRQVSLAGLEAAVVGSTSPHG